MAHRPDPSPPPGSSLRSIGVGGVDGALVLVLLVFKNTSLVGACGRDPLDHIILILLPSIVTNSKYCSGDERSGKE